MPWLLLQHQGEATHLRDYQDLSAALSRAWLHFCARNNITIGDRISCTASTIQCVNLCSMSIAASTLNQVIHVVEIPVDTFSSQNVDGEASYQRHQQSCHFLIRRHFTKSCRPSVATYVLSALALLAPDRRDRWTSIACKHQCDLHALYI